MSSMLSHTQAKSVVSHDVVPTASIMHGIAHSGKMEMSWAVAVAAARARTALVYFMVVVVVVFGAWVRVE